MDLLESYLNKHTTGNPLIKEEPAKRLKYIVVIPAYNETRLEESLVSLLNAVTPIEPVEVIVVINWPEDASEEVISLSHELSRTAHSWGKLNSSEKIQFHFVMAGYMPRKKAGVGYARKTGMDEAVGRFLRAGQKDGIIISFDADTLCDANYLVAIEEHFREFPSTPGCSVYFEHPLEGMDFPSMVYKAIIQYELHMRYYLHSVRHTGFPNAFYTVGSAFAVRASGYCLQGGMNVRKAGEDFYFLQKFFDLGNFSDLLKTRVRPSPRPSLRVPFGTGKAIDQLLNSQKPLKSYNPVTFEILKEFFESVPRFYEELSAGGEPGLIELNHCLIEFLEDCRFMEELKGIYKNSGSEEAFTKRFFRYFNMFRILKFAKHSRKTYPDLPVAVDVEDNLTHSAWLPAPPPAAIRASYSPLK